MTALWAALTITDPAMAAPTRVVSLCAENGAGSAIPGQIQVWSEKLKIEPDPANEFPFGEDGCATVSALTWEGRPFLLRPWIEIVYRATAPGHHSLLGRFLVRKGKRDNRVTLLMEPSNLPGAAP